MATATDMTPVQADSRRNRGRARVTRAGAVRGRGAPRRPETMAIRIRHLSTRFALLLAAAAVLPLLAYGVVSLISLQRGTRDSVVTGNLNVATRAAEEIRRYVTTNAELLKALAADLQNTGLEQLAAGPHPQELRPAVPRIPRDHAVRRSGRAPSPRAASARRASQSRSTPAVTLDGVAMSPMPRGRRPAADGRLRRPPARTSTSPPAGSSASSASKKCGGWSIASASASTATRWSSRPTASSIAHGDPDKKAAGGRRHAT